MTRSIRKWSDDADATLQDCFASTDWKMFRDFNLSLTKSVIPTCFKQTPIVPVPKAVKVTCINEYRLVVLTSVAMKCFERLVMAHINSILPGYPRPTQICISPQQIHR